MVRAASVLLEFNTEFDPKKKKLRDGLSAVVQIGDALWLANDETLTLERLACLGDDGKDVLRYGNHEQFQLANFFNLPVMPDNDKDIVEADIEGLAVDETNHYLWLIGSHSLKRTQPEEDKSLLENLKRLKGKSTDGNRFILARIPVVQQGDSLTLAQSDLAENRTAAKLSGTRFSDALTDALVKDEHLGDFFAIPSKDNGFDIEGLAVVGKRLFIGLRGPVLRGWAIILEIEPQEEAAGSDVLKLAPFTSDGGVYRKHFLQLGGLGIRDLCVQGSDMLIMAGPTMDLDGPVTVSRWNEGAHPREASLVFSSRITKLLDIPYGQGRDAGKDHAEGMSLFTPGGDSASAIVVVYDSASKTRKHDENAVEADIFLLPG
jgi:hypothetical protein